MFINAHPGSLFFAETLAEALSRAEVQVKNVGRKIVIYEIKAVRQVIPPEDRSTPLLPPKTVA